jgi:outer membrane protein assembly factor BamD (BamD/ComL family)
MIVLVLFFQTQIKFTQTMNLLLIHKYYFLYKKKLISKSYKKAVSIIILLALFFTSYSLSADDHQSQQACAEGIKLMESKNYRAAADKFEAAILYADSLQLKANGLKLKAEAYKKGKLLYQEFVCLKELISNFPESCDINELVNREYEIGNQFYYGYRDTPFLWLPWITDDNKSKEIYETILKQSPYAKFIPDMLVKLGYMYLKAGQNDKAITVYTKVIDKHPSSKASQGAHLDLANIYLQLAQKGDGDGENTSNARRILLLYIKRFPNTPEAKWAKNNLKETYELEAARLYQLADYYNRNNNQKAAKRYIKQILVNYPDSKSTDDAEKLLDAINMPIYPMKKLPTSKEESKYKVYSLPESKKKKDILVSPQNSGGKWLTPIKDLDMIKEKEDQEKYMEML